jgi:cytochrome P450
LIGRFLPPHLPYITESINSVWHSKRLPYTRARTSILSDISLFGNHVYLNVATPGAVRVLNADRKTFRKPTEVYKLLKGFGENLVVTEGEEWRRHRKVGPV